MTSRQRVSSSGRTNSSSAASSQVNVGHSSQRRVRLTLIPEEDNTSCASSSKDNNRHTCRVVSTGRTLHELAVSGRQQESRDSVSGLERPSVSKTFALKPWAAPSVQVQYSTLMLLTLS
jgi:hypothetical protein